VFQAVSGGKRRTLVKKDRQGRTVPGLEPPVGRSTVHVRELPHPYVPGSQVDHDIQLPCQAETKVPASTRSNSILELGRAAHLSRAPGCCRAQSNQGKSLLVGAQVTPSMICCGRRLESGTCLSHRLFQTFSRAMPPTGSDGRKYSMQCAADYLLTAGLLSHSASKGATLLSHRRGSSTSLIGPSSHAHHLPARRQDRYRF
jgi:hypothetical protein